MNLFGKKKAAPAPKLSDSIAQLREAQSMLDKREKHLEKQMAQAKDAAKEKLKAKDKRGALFLLKRAKLYETQINSIYGKRQNIDMQVMALEAASSNKEIFQVMKVGKDALKSATAQLDVDAVADTMEDITETMQMQEEVDQQLSQPIGPAMDEEDLEKELAELDEEINQEQLLETPSVPVKPIAVKSQPTIDLSDAPVVPTGPISAGKEVNEEKRPTVVLAGGGGGGGSHVSSSGTGGAAKKHPNVTDKEAEELKALEAAMGL